MVERITPRTLKGFRDFIPEMMLPRERLIDIAKAVYRSYGFAPIETPALEHSEILLRKGGVESDKQLYRFNDPGGRDVALRFDLTVPLARFVAQHLGTLGMPFKRYHVGPVWRGENTQRGRYREFVQCDFDTIGTSSVLADIETVLVIHDLFNAFGFERFTIRINDRRVLAGLLERIGLETDSIAVLRAIDKIRKAGPSAVQEELEFSCGATSAQAEKILRFLQVNGSNEELLIEMEDIVQGSDEGQDGIDDLSALFKGIKAAGADTSKFQLDPSIARGLDYYTGVVYETFLDDLPEIGSCCSGGRYDNLAAVYSKEELPGVGASLGVDRLLVAMTELGMIEKRSVPAEVLVTIFDDERAVTSLEIAAELRRAGVDVELYPDARRLRAQLRYANRKGHRVAVIVGPEEMEAGTVQLKDLLSGSSQEVQRIDLVSACCEITDPIDSADTPEVSR